MIQLFKNKSLKKTQETENISLNERTQEKDKKQRGRSMVEMLGVLAIIGVLSIGGIQGYTMAMRRYRANEILNIANKYALLVYSQIQNILLIDPDKLEGHEDETETGHLYSYLDASYVSGGIIPAFTDSGLGNYPNGVNTIWAASVLMDRKNVQSGDVVSIEVHFTDKELCKTVDAIINDPYYVNDCNYSDDFGIYVIPFYMN